MEQAACALIFSKSGQVVHDCHLVLRGKAPPKLGIICQRYWLLNLAPTFGQLMGPHPKTSYSKLTTCQKYEVFIC